MEPIVSKAEARLVEALGARGIVVKRQVSVPAPHGIRPFSLDVALVDARIDVEVDGPHHETPAQRSKDAYRDAWLARQGWRVIRVPVSAIDDDVDGVAAKLARSFEHHGAFSWSIWPRMTLRRVWGSRVALLLVAAALEYLAVRIVQAGYAAQPSIALLIIAVLLALRVALLDNRWRSRVSVTGRRRKPFGLVSDIAVMLIFIAAACIAALWHL